MIKLSPRLGLWFSHRERNPLQTRRELIGNLKLTSSDMMQIWVDADACPNVIKEILFRAAKRVEVKTILVANQELQIPASPYIDVVQVRSGLDIADNYIVQQLQPGDLVITADIPLAANAIEKGAYALNPRGEFYDQGNIRERLSMRNFLEELRSGGVVTGGPPPFNQRDREAFAVQLI